MDPLDAVSPVDGRYRGKAKPLAGYFSERALMSYRTQVEVEYLIALSEHEEVSFVREFTGEEKEFLREMYPISLEDAKLIKRIEVKDHGIESINKGRRTNHDVKAVEYFMGYKLNGTSLEDCVNGIHFALTSEDVTNLAYGLMLSRSIQKVLMPELDGLEGDIYKFSENYGGVPMLSRTHGQPATPTTMGKEFRIFSDRLQRQKEKLRHNPIYVKLNGASGNWCAHKVAYSGVDWMEFTRNFVSGLSVGLPSLETNLVTTQIEPHDTYAEMFDGFRRVNTIVLDFCQDMWRYVSDDWMVQKPREGEVGSSTMPHKVNPIDFENGEGNLGIANALFGYFSSNLPVSRLQRHLSDSTVERNFGAALAHSLISYKSARRGLSKVSLNEDKVREVLNEHPEVISEAIQTVLRREGVEMPYERLKELTRGRRVTMEDFGRFIEELEVSREIKGELHGITPENYTGYAEEITKRRGINPYV